MFQEIRVRKAPAEPRGLRALLIRFVGSMIEDGPGPGEPDSADTAGEERTVGCGQQTATAGVGSGDLILRIVDSTAAQ